MRGSSLKVIKSCILGQKVPYSDLHFRVGAWGRSAQHFDQLLGHRLTSRQWLLAT
jgi:hypothetical protein